MHACRLQTEEGEQVGPHRVWLGDVWLPGLAMSRAMGDTMARRHASCSVSFPMAHTYKLVMAISARDVLSTALSRAKANALSLQSRSHGNMHIQLSVLCKFHFLLCGHLLIRVA